MPEHTVQLNRSLNGNTFLSLPCSDQSKSIRKVKRTCMLSIPDTKSTAIMPHLLFSCDMTNRQHVDYVCLADENKDDMELDRLDVIMNPQSTIEIRCSFLLNSLDHVLEYPSWFHQSLDQIMNQCGLHLVDTAEHSYHYEMKKAFITPPLSYLMDQQVPHGRLNQMDLVFDWSTSKPKEFQTVWKRGLFESDLLARYIQDALYQLIIKKTCYLYPLVFSNYYVKKLSSIMSYIPHIAQSLQKIYTTSKATMSVNNHEFSQALTDKIKTIQKNTDIMHAYHETEEEEDKIDIHLILGMYHSVRTVHKQKPSPNQKVVIDPPNAMCTIAKLWSTTASTSSSMHT